MALCFCNFNNTPLSLSFQSHSLFKSLNFSTTQIYSSSYSSSSFSVRSLPISSQNEDDNNNKKDDDNADSNVSKKRLSEQSSWEAKDSEGNDYLYRLGKEADNMNIAVGARTGVIDDVFAGNFLGRDSDIVFDYRHKVTRSFQYLQGDYYIAPVFMDKVACHIVKNYIAHLLNTKVPLILGIWGGKGQGKSFQTELIFQAMGIEPVIMSAGELESERAGEPGKLIRERYRTASQVVQNQGKMSCLMINDIDAGLGRFGNTQMTVNNQIVVGTLMNLSDNPTRVSIGQEWRESDVTNRIPIIVTGNDLSTIYAPLIRDGRMDKFYWQPDHEDIVNIVRRMYEKDGVSRDEVVSIVNTFPNQALDFYGALRSRTYDRSILKVFSQPITSSSAERNWSTYSFIHNVKRNRLNSSRADKLVFIHSNIRLQSRFTESYKDGPFKKWDIDPKHTYMDDSAVRLEDLRWKSLEGDCTHISSNATYNDNIVNLMPTSTSKILPPTSSKSSLHRTGLHQTQISNFAKGGANSKDKGKAVEK